MKASVQLGNFPEWYLYSQFVAILNANSIHLHKFRRVLWQHLLMSGVNTILWVLVRVRGLIFMPLNTESERYTLLKEKITKQALSPVRNKEDAAFCSEDCFFVLFLLPENAKICEWKEVDGIWVRITGERGRMADVAETGLHSPPPICPFLLSNNFSWMHGTLAFGTSHVATQLTPLHGVRARCCVPLRDLASGVKCPPLPHPL